MQNSSEALSAWQYDLTEDEIECLYLAAEGREAVEIGVFLSLDRTHAEDLLFSAQAKLGAKNRLHAVSLALTRGILTDRRPQ